jgi:flavin-dependent dehydrogenase
MSSPASSFDTDVVVVGAGPAGAAAALWACRHGLDVMIVDKSPFPRDKTCGDGLTATCLRELEAMDVDVRGVAQPILRTEMTGPYGSHLDLPMEAGLRPGALMSGVVRRVDFDPLVLGAARDAGAALREATVTTVSDDGDGVTVHGNDDDGGFSVRARHCIGADGAYSIVRRHFATDDPARMPGMHAIRQYMDAPESNLLSVFFDESLLPGYGWIFPLPGGGVNIGVGVQRDPADHGEVTRAALTNDRGRVALRGLAGLYRGFLERPDVRDRLGGDPVARANPLTDDDRVRAWPIPADPDLGCVGAGRILLVGDAARLADPITGEGLGQALLSGRLAADAVAAAAPVTTAVRYRGALDAELGRDMRFARFLLRALRHRRGVEWAFAAIDTNSWTRRNFARWMYEDYPRALVLTPSRWRDHSMRGRGAYGGRRTTHTVRNVV